MIERRQHLAIRAALCPHPEAIAAWRQLRATTSIEELDHSVTRALPSVYRNIKSEIDGLDLSKLRGSARHTWAKNTEFLHQLQPLIKELARDSINYRVLKGGAINLLFNPPDFRIMGDIDLLIAKSDIAKVRDALGRAGFTPKYAVACAHGRKSGSKLESSFINQRSLEIDLHLAEERAEAPLFKRALKLPPRIVHHTTSEIPVPQIEIMIIHSILHGLLAVESEDKAQMILDVEILSRFVNRDLLENEVSRLNLAKVFNSYLQLRSEILGPTEGVLAREISIPGKLRIRNRLNLNRAYSLLVNLVRAVKFRAPRLQDLHRIWMSHNRNRLLYILWLYLGLIRQFERIVTTRFSGFLQINYPDRKLSPSAAWSNDWRFRVSCLSQEDRVAILLKSKAFTRQSFLIFSNGKLAAVTEQNEEGRHLLVLKHPAESNEISLRLPFSGCRECAQSLADLKIT